MHYSESLKLFLPVREHAQETTTAAEKEHLSRKRKEFNQEQKRKEKEKRQRIINREKKRAVKRIHLKRLAILFSRIAPRFVYIGESASATNKQQSHLLEDPIYNIIHQIKRTSDFLYSSVKDYPILLCITEKTELIKHGTRLKKEDEQDHMKVLWKKSRLERQRKASSDNNRKAM